MRVRVEAECKRLQPGFNHSAIKPTTHAKKSWFAALHQISPKYYAFNILCNQRKD